MAFFDELSKKLSGVSRVAVRKAKEVTDIGSLKLQIADENRKLSKIYENLGREYYDRFQDEAAEELSGLVKQIKDSTDKIAALQDEISRVEAESAARAEEERVRREAEAQARRESVAEAEMLLCSRLEGIPFLLLHLLLSEAVQRSLSCCLL